MTTNRQTIERDFFRLLNSIVEPAVRKGFGSFRFLPSTLIVLESTGYKSGQQRRTPLFSVRLGRYFLISTFRGERSFWLRNLQQKPEIQFYSHLISAESAKSPDAELPFGVGRIRKLLTPYTRTGWSFALLTEKAVA
jgi:F420H(2)-dependent quinone reductase